MKNKLLITILLFVLQPCYSQKAQTLVQPKPVNEYAQVDKITLQMPDSDANSTQGIATYINSKFTTTTKKARAIFIWIAFNIQYDVENMYAINFEEKTEDKISKVLKTRKGICENYAALFNDIALKCGLKSFVIEGYTKQNGFADYIPHAWCATLIDTSWYLFDPTWGSGYINNSKFYRRINNEYFKASPSKFIKSHMPFDPMWEFLYYPVTNQEFYEGKIQLNKTKPYFNFNDSIKTYENETEIDQWISSASRIEKNGVKNSLIFNRLSYLKRNIEIYNQNQKVNRENLAVNLYNDATKEYNEGIVAYNDFINYRNNQFTPIQPDDEIRALIDAAKNKLTAAKNTSLTIQNENENTRTLMTNLLKSIDDAMNHVNEQEDFVTEYLSKGRAGRKAMFYKTTWFGIPLK